MKQIAILALAVGMSITPAMAQDQTDPETEDGLSLIEEGARMLLRGLLDEVEPTMKELSESLTEMGPAFTEFAQSVGPALAELLNQVDDFRNYEAPEFLPNGDIIIRRAPDAPHWQPQPDPETGEIEL